MAELNKYSTVAVLEKSPDSLGHSISESEKALRLETKYDRQAEASLFIDRKFLSYALITGETNKPEQIFGPEAWADYLDGRLFTRQYGNQYLTPDFILDLHTQLTKRSNPNVSGKIRNIGIVGGSYDNLGQPVTYTKEQVEAIEANPVLAFQREPKDDEGGTTGFIIYPHSDSIGTKTKEAIAKDLNELCEWFNNEKQKETYDPFTVAGLLQHKLISLHPFLDGNGRLTRVLMNWSLENDGEAPSVIDNPGEDILTDEPTWISRITDGSNQYKALKKRQKSLDEADIDNINALFNLGQDKAFYEYIFRYFKQAPSLTTSGDLHTHQVYEEFLAGFKEEMNRFQEYMQITSKVQTADGEREVSQGGLITPEFMDFATSPNTQVLPMELRKQFFSDIEAYRGGMVGEEIDDQKLCQMFQSYVGVGTGYRALDRASRPATSAQQINVQVIRESMDYYNKMFASLYFAKKHPEMENPYANMPNLVRDLDTVVQDHVVGGQDIWNSPFVSTSLKYNVGIGWAKRFSALYAKNARHGVLFKTHLPKEGMVMTFGQNFKGLTATGIPFEYEALVTGGLQPASIVEIEVYDKGNLHQNPGLKAKRVIEDGKVNIVIEDRQGKFVVNRTYTYNPNTPAFVLSGEEETLTLSATPINQPDTYHPVLPSILGSFKKQYIPPFGSIEGYPHIFDYTIQSKENLSKFIKQEDYKIIPSFDEISDKLSKSYPFELNPIMSPPNSLISLLNSENNIKKKKLNDNYILSLNEFIIKPKK